MQILTFLWHLPSKKGRIVEVFPKERCFMHQLLRNAAHIDASATQAPSGAHRGRFDEVKDHHLLAEGGCLLGRSNAAGTASNDGQVVVVLLESTLEQLLQLALLAGNDGGVAAADMVTIHEDVRNRLLVCFGNQCFLDGLTLL